MNAPVPTGYSAPEAHTESVTLPARPESLRMKPSETAVIVVDMQNAYASAGGYLDIAGFDVTGAADAILKTKAALDAARKAGVTVIFFQNGWDKDYVEAGTPGSPNWHKSNALKTMRARPELAGTLLAKGTWDYAIVDALQPQPGDIVIPKTRYSGFFNTNIDSVLRARGIRNLVFTGVATNVCVESSLRDAFHLEYFAVVLEDATHHAGPDFVQQAALYNIEKFFGWVSTVADFCGAIGQSAPLAAPWAVPLAAPTSST
ncbi:MAG: ureidoacrylate peracid hydrolase [Acetobacteraceae bacterium]|jgi:ureidoacrylate peracid hydrolase|nr:ureidoacrylate peracid hydrolase [Acetobacteraceae bacterium]